MAGGVNKAILIGRLGKDPNVRQSAAGDSICSFSIATTETWLDKSKVKQEKTEWHRIVMFKRLAEIGAEYLRKGAQVYIEGRIQTREWKDESDKQHYITEIVARQMQMLGRPKETERSFGEAPPPPPEDIDDEIPF